MTGSTESDRIVRETVSEMATVFVRRDPDALILVTRMAAERGLSAVDLMISSAWLVGDVINTGLGTASGRRPTRAEAIAAWRQFAETARDRMASALDRLADEQVRAGMPEPEVRRAIAESAAQTDAGLATALPLLTAFLTGDEAALGRGLNEAAKKKQVRMAVLATQLVIRDLFTTAVNTAVGGEATEAQVLGEWEKFMARRAASKRNV
jgi:hypothetical protein